MADKELQAVLNTNARTPLGQTILRSVQNSAGITSHYVIDNGGPSSGTARWVDVTTADSDANKGTAIRAALAKRR